MAVARNQVPDSDGNLVDVRPATNPPVNKADVEQSPRERAEFVRLLNAQPFETRTITPSNWGAVGIDGPTVEWSKHNSFAVPIEVFDFLNDTQFATYIEGDSRFSVEGERAAKGDTGGTQSVTAGSTPGR